MFGPNSAGYTKNPPPPRKPNPPAESRPIVFPEDKKGRMWI